jgi:hypothetical protein
MITNNCRIDFGFKDDMQKKTPLTFSYDVAFASPKHDVVILELAKGQKMLPQPLQLMNINVCCSKLHVIGSKSTAHGASGSPLIVVNDILSRNEKTVQAKGMLLRGFPPAYYNKSTEEEVPPDVLIESGISMEKIKSLLEEHSLHDLANDLFT